LLDGKRLKSVTKGKVHLGTEEEKKQLEEQVKTKEAEHKFPPGLPEKLNEYIKQIRCRRDWLIRLLAWLPGSMSTARIWNGCYRKEREVAEAAAYHGT
jgi:hypothetical protein